MLFAVSLDEEMITEKLNEIIRCPVCKGALVKTDKALVCAGCESDYQIGEAYPILLPGILSGKIKRNACAWNRVPYDYDEFIGKTSKKIWNVIDVPLVALCKTGNCVLEIGCGTARLEAEVRRRSAKYIGLDPSDQLLQKAVEKGAQSLVKGVGEYLPFAKASFDVVLGGYCSFRYIQFDKVLSECYRVLRPGGWLAFSLWNAWGMMLSEVLDNIRFLLKGTKPYLPRLGMSHYHDVVLPWREISMLGKFGFTHISILSTKKIPFLHRRLRYPYWHGPLGALFGHDVIFLCQKK